MSWYDSDWKHRLPVTILPTGAGGTYDIEFQVPDHYDHFWETVDTNGEDVRVTDADGRTLETYDLNGFNKTTRACTFEVDGASLDQNKIGLLWLYYGATGKSTAATTFAPASAVTGYIAVEEPSDVVILAARERPGATKPSAEVAKTPAEEINVYLDVTDVLIGRARTSELDTRYEEPLSAVAIVTDGGADQSLVTAARCMWVEVDQRLYLRVRVTGGTTGTDYTIEFLITTTGLDYGVSQAGRIIEPRALLKVREVSEA